MNAPVGVPFTIGEIPCMVCTKCGICRELSQFWRPGYRNKPIAACDVICTTCR